jgi:cation:H+ antiporter
MTRLLLLAGMACLVLGAEGFVGGASALARRFRVSELVIGLTIVSMGTSAPELVVNVLSALRGSTGLAFGNVLGSNNINLFLILGLSGLIAPLAVRSPTVWREIPFSAAAALLLAALVLPDGLLGRGDAVVLLVGFVAFLAYAARGLRADAPPAPAGEDAPAGAWWRPLPPLLAGLGGLVLGGRLVVDQATAIAAAAGMSERVIGLTVVALGTSLPELATSAVAAARGKADIAVGNVVGSNLFNLLFILGVTGAVAPVAWDPAFNADLGLLVGGTALLFAAMFSGARPSAEGRRGHRLDRWEAALLLATIVAYTALWTLR